MKIFFAVHHFPPKFISGGERETFNLALELQRRGHEVIVACFEDIRAPIGQGIEEIRENYAGLDVRRLRMNPDAAPDLARWEYDNPWIAAYIREALTHDRPDIFHLVSGYLMTGSALVAAKNLAIPTAVTLLDFWFLCPRITLMRSDGTLSQIPLDMARCAQCLGEEKRRYRYASKVMPGLLRAYWKSQTARITQLRERSEFLKSVLDSTNLIISRSRYLKKVYAEAGVSEERITFLRQGIDPVLVPLLARKSRSNGKLRVGYLGQLAWHKGVDLAIDAMELLDPQRIELRIYGSELLHPEYASALRKRAKGASNVHFSGTYQNQAELDQVFSDLDVIVVPSRWYENSPNVILEAFAHRTPVIATNLGGMAELIDEGHTGLLFDPGDSASLADKCNQFLEAPLRLDALEQDVLPLRSLSKEVDEMLELYRKHIFEPATYNNPIS